MRGSITAATAFAEARFSILSSHSRASASLPSCNPSQRVCSALYSSPYTLTTVATQS